MSEAILRLTVLIENIAQLIGIPDRSLLNTVLVFVLRFHQP